MNFYLHLFEMIIFLIFCFILVYSIVITHEYYTLTTYILSICTVLAGEIINAEVTKTAVYRDGYLIFLPLHIPLSIVFGGILLSWLLYKLTVILTSYSILFLKRKYPEKIQWKQNLIKIIFFGVFPVSILLILSFFLPIVEIAGQKFGLWRWRHPIPYNIFWFIGVWLFYFKFIAIAAFPASIAEIKNRERVKLRRIFCENQNSRT